MIRWKQVIVKALLDRKHLFVAAVVGSTLGVVYLNRHFLEMRLRGNLAKLPNAKERVITYLKKHGLVVRDYTETSGLTYKERDDDDLRSFKIAVDDPSQMISAESLSRLVDRMLEDLDRDAA